MSHTSTPTKPKRTRTLLIAISSARSQRVQRRARASPALTRARVLERSFHAKTPREKSWKNFSAARIFVSTNLARERLFQTNEHVAHSCNAQRASSHAARDARNEGSSSLSVHRTNKVATSAAPSAPRSAVGLPRGELSRREHRVHLKMGRTQHARATFFARTALRRRGNCNWEAQFERMRRVDDPATNRGRRHRQAVAASCSWSMRARRRSARGTSTERSPAPARP